MIDFSRISQTSLLGKALRVPLTLIPESAVFPILRGRLRGQKWIVGSGNHGYWLGSYELNKQRIFEETIKDGSVVFDVGAHAGFYTLLASSLVGSKGTVVAFEPSGTNLFYLKEHLRLNSVDNVELMEVAVSDACKDVFFAEGEDNTFTGHLSSSGETRVRAVSLDELFERGKIPLPNYVKIDIEGEEMRALLGAKRILEQSHATLFLATHGNESREQCSNFLKEIGYEVQSLHASNLDQSDEIVASPKCRNRFHTAQDTRSLRVTFSANISYYSNTAVALQNARILKRYICAIGVKPLPKFVSKMFPNYWGIKLRSRQTEGIDSEKLKTIWLPELLQKGLPITGFVSMKRGNWIASHLFDFLASYHVTDCDILHVFSGVGLYSARRAKQRGAVVVCDQNTPYRNYERRLIREEYEKLGLTFEPPGLLSDGKIKATYELADYIIVPSDFAMRSFVEAGYEPDKMFIVPYGAEIKPRTSQIADPDGVFRIICVAQIVPRKGVHYLVQAFEELGLTNAELLLVGPVREGMEALVQSWTENPQIVVTGSIPVTQINEHYSKSSLFVLPSISEGSALVTYEAMSSGLPVVVSENTGSGSLVRDGVEGFILPIRDVEVLKERILRVYESPLLREQMGEAARDRVNNFSWEKYGERLVKVYEEIARRERLPF